METKLCKELVAGDKILLENDDVVEVSHIGRSFIFGKTLISFTNGGWAHTNLNTPIALA